jgi:hypothetical protein
MDNKFLNRVVEQIISETRIDWDEGMVNVPFHPFFLGPLYFVQIHILIFIVISSFTNHCRDIYSLNKVEVEYVWDKYRHIVKDKIESYE